MVRSLAVLFLICGIQSVSADEVKDLYGFTGEILKDSCIVGQEYDAGLWTHINQQQAAYKRALDALDYGAAAILTPIGWVQGAMISSQAKVVLNDIDTADPNRATLNAAEELFLDARNALKTASDCATRSLSQKQVQDKIESLNQRILRGMLFVSRCRGELPWPKE